MIVQERTDLANLLRELTTQEWERESLCLGWRVRDVIAHLLYEATPPLTYGFEFLRARGSADKLNDLYVRRAQSMTTAELLRRFEATIGGGLAATTLPRVALADLLVHHQDIRRPLGRDRKVPEDRLRTVLRHPDPFLRTGLRTKGLRLTATDVDWTQGHGPEVQGPGEAIILAGAGRRAALDDLSGEGVQILRNRLG
ncbi:maleylpyruvate isomerase family mycothiol-dependent enzyme [Nocardia yunnanensis]|uniref:Maleylpyruvate isomerase family mycothiol-dependent enzyme n=2 Tax=Nocardia yunnanensis TaxID=2382165 RepID=A0A386ZJU0_9NOCA|nr:maleylpyruvate isomerase family mycothiol-dependent enzyme [Nocardia yunnanensis]